MEEDLKYKIVGIYKKLEQKSISKSAFDSIMSLLDKIDNVVEKDKTGFQGRL